MQDRVSLYPGRVTLTPVAGQENTYDMKRADQPTQDGDPLSKDTFLKDTTAALFGLGNTALPDEILQALSNAAFYKNGVLQTVLGSQISQVKITTGSYVGTGKDGASAPNSLSADFNIDYFLVQPEGVISSQYYKFSPIGAVKGLNAYFPPGSGSLVSISWNNKSVSWYSDNDTFQANESGRTYKYLIIGHD